MASQRLHEAKAAPPAAWADQADQRPRTRPVEEYETPLDAQHRAQYHPLKLVPAGVAVEREQREHVANRAHVRG